MSLGPNDLVLCAGTLPAAGFAERVEAAAAAGFSGVSLFASDYARARSEGLADGELRRILADHGVAVAELDPLLRWVPGVELAGHATEQGEAFFRHGEDDFYRIADALGARSLNAVLVTDAPLAPARIAEAFAGLCDRAARHGLLVHLEFLPWTSIQDVRAALELVEQADRANGGVMLDTWHHFRGPAHDAVLRGVPGERILGVQLSDAPRRPEPDPVAETLHRRLLPGQGDVDLVRILRLLDATGCKAPLGVEVFSDELAKLAPREAAARAGEATRALLGRARERG